MQPHRTLRLHTHPQPRPQGLVPLRCRCQPLQQRAQIQPGSPGNDRHLAAPADLCNRRPCMARVVAGRAGLIRPVQIEAMVRHPRPLLRRRLGRTDIHQPVHRHGVAADNLAAQLFRERNGERRLAARGRAGDHNQWRLGWLDQIRCRYQCRHHPGKNTRSRPARQKLATSTTRASSSSPRTMPRRSVCSACLRRSCIAASSRCKARDNSGACGGDARCSIRPFIPPPNAVISTGGRAFAAAAERSLYSSLDPEHA